MLLNELFTDFGDSPGKKEVVNDSGLLNVCDFIKKNCSNIVFANKETGKLFYIFPLNGFNYTWSTKYKDIGKLNVYPNESEENALDLLNRLTYVDDTNFRSRTGKETSKIPFSINVAKKIVHNLGFTDQQLSKALDSGHELAITGKYVAINISVVEPEELMDWLK